MYRLRAGARLAGRLVGIATLVAVTAGGCTSSPTSAPGGASASQTATGAAPSLRGVCPDPIVIQTNWWPQAEFGALFQLLGTNPIVDADHKRVTGRLVAQGLDTGVRLEIRSGGPANGYTPAARELYLDPSITLGGVDIDQAVQLSGGNQPVQAVFAPLDKSPLVLMWDPATYPNFHTVADIGATDTKVLYFQGAAYMDYLVGAGKLHRSQVDPSYDGTPSRFIAERGRIVQQGFLTNEVYQYVHELPQWNKKVAWTLVNDNGYPTYPETLAIRPDRKAALAPCLRKLVPMMQRATVDYTHQPASSNTLIVSLVKQFGAYPYNAARAAYALQAMLDNGILGNGGNGAIGDFDSGRVTQIIDAVDSVTAPAGTKVKPGLVAGDVTTNDFIDSTIGLK